MTTTHQMNRYAGLLAWAMAAPTLQAAEHILYATEVHQSSTNDWMDESEAQGEPTGNECNSNNARYAYNPTTNSLEKLRAVRFQSLQLSDCHVITRVRVNVMCRYNLGFTGRVSLRLLAPGIDHTIVSDAFPSETGNGLQVLSFPRTT